MSAPALTSSGRLLAAASLLTVAACGDPTPPQPLSGRLAPPAISSFDAPPWAAVAADDPVVGRVNGAPIPASLLASALAAAPDRSPREVLDALIELELLAQAAVRRDLLDAPAVVRAWRQAMAARYLRDGFEVEIGPDDIPLEDVKRIYWMPNIRQLYDHADAWNMAHLYFTCCDPKSEDCSTPEVLSCFEQASREISEVYAEIKPRVAAVEGDPAAVVAVMKDYRSEVEERWPQLAYRELAFFYDPDKPHAEQKGYDITDESVARAVIAARTGYLPEPVQSRFGWHIVLKRAHEPEIRKGPDDPEVIRDIRRNAFDAWQRAKFGEQVATLRQRWRVETFPGRLELLEAAGPQEPPAP